MVLTLGTKTQMKYGGVYLINIYSCFSSFEREKERERERERDFLEVFLILQFAKMYPRITWVF